ncbi:MAG: hypothetical protein ACRDZV_13455, partial [Acidimicrobiia bacterium]
GVEAAGLPVAVLDDLVSAGLLTSAAGRVALTRRGRLLATDVTARLLAAGEAPSLALGTLEC